MGGGALCLRSGRDALKTIAREYNPTIVLIPALSCESMFSPFIAYGHHVAFYRLLKDFSVDLNNVECLLKGNDANYVIFMYNHFLGNKAIDDSILAEMKSRHPNLVFVDDRTQVFLSDLTFKFDPDYIVVSVRKWVNIPDGGLLWIKKPLANQVFSEDTSFSEKRLRAQCLRNQFLLSGKQELKNEYRSIFSSVAGIIDSSPVPGRMSEYSFELVKKTDFDAIKLVREKNARELFDKLCGTSKIQLVQVDSSNSLLYVAFLTEKRDYIQSILSSMGLFCTVIWPLNMEQCSTCEVANDTEKRILAAPCDQRYSISDMDFIGDRITKVLNE